MELEGGGFSYQKLAPNFRPPAAHRHQDARGGLRRDRGQRPRQDRGRDPRRPPVGRDPRRTRHRARVRGRPGWPGAARDRVRRRRRRGDARGLLGRRLGTGRSGGRLGRRPAERVRGVEPIRRRRRDGGDDREGNGRVDRRADQPGEVAARRARSHQGRPSRVAVRTAPIRRHATPRPDRIGVVATERLAEDLRRSRRRSSAEALQPGGTLIPGS